MADNRSNTQNLAKALLQEIGTGKNPNPINSDKDCPVQFNPESLKVSFSNQISKPEGAPAKKRETANSIRRSGHHEVEFAIVVRYYCDNTSREGGNGRTQPYEESRLFHHAEAGRIGRENDSAPRPV